MQRRSGMTHPIQSDLIRRMMVSGRQQKLGVGLRNPPEVQAHQSRELRPAVATRGPPKASDRCLDLLR
eukprot:7230489-Pyramimonas_sp.AAC.1